MGKQELQPCGRECHIHLYTHGHEKLGMGEEEEMDLVEVLMVLCGVSVQ